ncbi:zinc finger, C2H2 type [Trichuris suis]|nr:zinc finger, C2H2 type [Trichuris suis]
MFKHHPLRVNKRVNRNVVKERNRVVRFHDVFGCSKCGKTFNRRSTLWNHAKIHSDLRPYGCSVCERRFKWKNSLLSHAKVHMRKNEITTIESMVDLKKIVRSRGSRNDVFADDNSFTSTYCTKGKGNEEEGTYDSSNFMGSMNVIRAHGYSEFVNREDEYNDGPYSCSSSSSSACNGVAPWVPRDFMANMNVVPACEYKEFVNHEDGHNGELHGSNMCNAVVPGVYMGYGCNRLFMLSSGKVFAQRPVLCVIENDEMQLTQYCLRDITVILPDVNFYQRLLYQNGKGTVASFQPQVYGYDRNPLLLWRATFDNDAHDLSYECFVNANDNVLLPVLKLSRRNMIFQSRKEEPIFYCEYLDNCVFDAFNANAPYDEKRWAICEYYYCGSDFSSTGNTDSESSVATYDDGISVENEFQWKDGDSNGFRYGDGLYWGVSEEKTRHGSILMARDRNFQLPRTYEFI